MADVGKRRAAERSLDYVEDGMVLGLGTGSTAAHLVRLLGARVRDGLRVQGVPTSRATEALAAEFGIPLVGFDRVTRIDLTIDGADEIDANLDLIKGGGGALLREKIVASVSDRYLIIADESKLVPRLGAFALPVEVTPFALAVVTARLEAEGAKPVLRRGPDGDAMVTDEGHHLLDCAYGAITDAAALARALTGIVGVVEHGLFVGMADVAVIGRDDGVEVIERAD